MHVQQFNLIKAEAIPKNYDEITLWIDAYRALFVLIGR